MFSSGRDTQSSAPVVSRSPSDKREGSGGGGGDIRLPPHPPIPPHSSAFHLMWLQLCFEARSKQKRRRWETKEF